MNKHSANYVEVAEECMQLKPWFREEPSDELIQEIREFTSETGEPWNWRGHSHTPPPKEGSPPKYCGRFFLPKDQVKKKEWAPCPCCSPQHRKFGVDGGLIAWFGDEGIIRLIGPRCFATLNQAGHDLAIADLRRREKEKSELDYIVRCLDRLPAWLASLDDLVQIAADADGFFPVLESRITVSLRTPIWREVRDGRLYVTRKSRSVRVDRDGREHEHTERTRDALFALDGHRALSPNRKPLSEGLAKAGADLAVYSNTERADVETRSLQQRQAISRDIRRILVTIDKGQRALEHEMSLVRQLNMNRLQQWAADPLSNVEFHIERVEGQIKLSGRKEYTLTLPEGLRSTYLPKVEMPILEE